MLVIYNSLTKSKQPFKPIHTGKATIYSCGPTVYDHVHIGNLRAFITDDLLQRVLRDIEKLKVTWVMNITDIDDKMIARINKLNTSDDPMSALNKLADKYTDAFIDDIESVGIRRADIAKLPRATDHIGAMQDLIRKLLEDKIAYISDGSIYFSLEKYIASGKKYGQLVSVDYEPRSRVTDDQDQKEGVSDFALWKAQKPGEPAWDFIWQDEKYPGRPGWHIECSVMSTKYLGQPFDIHTGGVDLRFPHNENEIAQCGGVQANYFVHNEFLNISGEKMSKSLGNVTELKNMPNPLAFRLLVLQAHYRSHMDFSEQTLSSAQERLSNLQTYVDMHILRSAPLKKSDNTGATKKFLHEFTRALEDDLNTPAAIAAFSHIEGKIFTQESLAALRSADDILGLNLFGTKPLTKQELDVVHSYELARKSQDYTSSDTLREELKQKYGLLVADTDSGSLISRI